MTQESRRVFLGLAFGVATAVVAGARPQMAPPQPPQAAPDPELFPPLVPLPKHDMRELKENQVSIKKDVDRLTQLVNELEKGLDSNDTKQVLSMDVIHKTEEIEKLAKQIRELVRA